MNDVLINTIPAARRGGVPADPLDQPVPDPPAPSARRLRRYAEGREAGTHDSLFTVTRLQARLWSEQAEPMNHDPYGAAADPGPAAGPRWRTPAGTSSRRKTLLERAQPDRGPARCCSRSTASRPSTSTRSATSGWPRPSGRPRGAGGRPMTRRVLVSCVQMQRELRRSNGSSRRRGIELVVPPRSRQQLSDGSGDGVEIMPDVDGRDRGRRQVHRGQVLRVRQSPRLRAVLQVGCRHRLIDRRPPRSSASRSRTRRECSPTTWPIWRSATLLMLARRTHELHASGARRRLGADPGPHLGGHDGRDPRPRFRRVRDRQAQRPPSA